MEETAIPVKLTQYSSGSGCGCKISPSVLKEMLASNDVLPSHPNLIVGHESNDDAAVYDAGNGTFIISTTDFFMPIVDDAFTFGKIAATNALSDVYAMGGTPIMAVAILGWPISKLNPALAAEVIEGGRFMCRMAGIPLAGGHTIESPEPFFGLAVTGTVLPEHLKKNNTAKEGDQLFLTKPLGVGIISTAAKRGINADGDLLAAISYMCTLNKMGKALGKIKGVNAVTDVTGFGLLGHLIEMTEGSQLSAEIVFEKIPVIPAAKRYASQFIYPDMTTKNFSAYSSKTTSLSAEQLFIMCDPQTSGGLLVSVAKDAVDEYLQCVRDFSLQGIADYCIGEMKVQAEKIITVV
ncbi:MAG: selenide, water dikinase SelD [Bacteroidota bacterium]|jgi:selenide,water dikinase